MSPLTIGRGVLGSGPGIGPDPLDFASQANHNPAPLFAPRWVREYDVGAGAAQSTPSWPGSWLRTKSPAGEEDST